jgi:hypothetical protein
LTYICASSSRLCFHDLLLAWTVIEYHNTEGSFFSVLLRRQHEGPGSCRKACASAALLSTTDKLVACMPEALCTRLTNMHGLQLMARGTFGNCTKSLRDIESGFLISRWCAGCLEIEGMTNAPLTQPEQSPLHRGVMLRRGQKVFWKVVGRTVCFQRSYHLQEHVRCPCIAAGIHGRYRR